MTTAAIHSNITQNTESVRDFLIDKLKMAEQAIKSTMMDNSTLKKQAVADREVRECDLIVQLRFIVCSFSSQRAVS